MSKVSEMVKLNDVLHRFIHILVTISPNWFKYRKSKGQRSKSAGNSGVYELAIV